MTSETKRALVVGAIIVAVLVAALFVGLTVFNRGEQAPDSDGSPSPAATDARAEVEQAYLQFWDVWADANEKLDPSQLDDVATGEALSALVEAVEAQRANNQPVRIRVEHNYQIAITDETTASVDDRYVNHSQRLDPETMEPIDPDPNAQVRKSHTMKKVEGVWKVAEIIEYR